MPHPTRRDLLVLGAAAAAAAPCLAAAALPAAAPRAARALPGAFRKALKIGMIGVQGSLQDRFAAAKAAGFHGVDMDAPGGPPATEVHEAAESTGLVVHGVVDSVHWNKPLSHPDPAVREAGRLALEQALRDAKAYGADSVLLVPAVVNKQVPYWDAWTRSQAEVRKVLPLCAELQIRLLIENVWNGFLLGPTELARYVDELASPWTGLYFDAGNLVRFGWPEHWVPILGHRIVKVDIKDFVRGKNSFDVALNEGDADWPAIVRELRAIGYSGWFTAEMKGGDQAYLTDLAARMDTFLQG